MDKYYDNQFKTSDLAMAATLESLGFGAVLLERNGGSKVVFIFDRKPGLDDTIQAYWANQSLVNPRLFFDTLKHLKTRIYSG